MSDSDVELLRCYAHTRAEDAFAELVRRRLKLVYSVALRQCAGDADLAAEVTQRVFADLARKAASLSDRAVLLGWLHRSTRFAASDAVRAQRRRHAREKKAIMLNPIPEDSARDAEWRELQPVLDDVMSELPDRDRDAVMLRFFENRGFRDVGAALRLSEDAARMRVERALEKLRRMLARRGITSTASALGVALAHHASASPPAGLASSVTTSAIGGAAASATLLGFMSTAKITSGLWGTAALLILSLATNVWLGTLPSRAMSSPAAPLPFVGRAEPAGTLGIPLTALTEDPAQMRDRLRAAGANPTLTRAMVEGLLRRQYREKLSAVRADRARNGWWRESWAGAMDRPPAMQDDPALLQAMVFDRLEQLFGPDPVEMALYDARFEYLSPENRRAAIALQREADRVAARGKGGENGTVEVTAARAREEQLATFVASLSPEERAEYELRRASGRTASRMGQIDATEAEFRAIVGIVNVPADKGGDWEPVAHTTRDDRMMQEMVKAIGFERAADYIWSGTPEYTIYARVAQAENLPAGTAGQVMQLAAETAERAIAISRDASLELAQKRAAMLALQQSVRPQFDALVPSAAQARLSTQALQWIAALPEGRFRLITTPLNINEGESRMLGTLSVEHPWPAQSSLPPRPRRLPQ